MLDNGGIGWESCTMSATMVREKRQTTLPNDVCKPAGIEPGDQIDWRFESGELRGRKLMPVEIVELGLDDVPANGILPRGMKFDPKDIAAAIREERDER